MASKNPASGARKALAWLAGLIIALGAVMGIGISTNNSTGIPLLALDLEGGTQMVLAPETSTGEAVESEQLNQAVEIIRARVDGSGVSESEITTQGSENVVVSMPGTPDQATRDLIQASANMEFRAVLASAPGEATPEEEQIPVDDIPEPEGEPADASDPNWITPELQDEFQKFSCEDFRQDPDRTHHDPEKPIIACDLSQGDGDVMPDMKYILGPVEVKGEEISSASYGLSQTPTGVASSSWGVQLRLDGEGTPKFRDVTSRITSLEPPRNQFAIVLDNEIVSAPQSNAVITDGRPEITGNFTEETAQTLAEQLQYGALPISFSIESEQQISATLGQDQLFWGLMAGLIGLGLVAVYQFYQYRALGLVTLSSLVVAGILTYQAIVLLGWSDNYRLSLAGIAGIIVAIGLTADSFIVYFERIKDEMRGGRDLERAVEYGWDRAKRTITVSKAVNLLASIVLYFVAVGNVRGFAFTLGLTAVADLIVVFLFTHPVMRLLSRTKFFRSGHPLSGMDPRLLDRKPLYQGAGKVREFKSEEETSKAATKKNKGAKKEAQRRQTIAEKRAAEKEKVSASQASDNEGKDS